MKEKVLTLVVNRYCQNGPSEILIFWK